MIELEFLTNEISKCCDNGNDKAKYRKAKGLLGSTKTTFDKASIDFGIARPYDDLIECVSELESYLNDL